MVTVNKNSGWNGDNRDPWGGSSNNQRQPNFENPFEGFQKNLNKLIPGGGKGKRNCAANCCTYTVFSDLP